MRRGRFLALLGAILVIVGCASVAGTSQASTPETLFGDQTTGIVTDPDPTKTVVGVQFRAAVAGSVTAIRYFKSAETTGTHVGKLARGTTVLASATFTGETASGWQQVTLPTPVAVTAGQTYTAYYTANNGRYAVGHNYSWPKVSGNLTGVKGVYTFTASAVPSKVYQSENYYVDVVFEAATVPTPTPTPTPTSASPTPTTTVEPTPTTTVEPTTTTAEPTPTTTVEPTPTTTVEPTTTAPTTTTTPPAAELKGWQINATNTGLAGVGLTCAALPLWTGGEKPAAGTTITERRITHPLDLSNGNITIERSCIQPTNSWIGLALLLTLDNNTGTPAPTTVTVRDSDIDGSLLPQYNQGWTTGFQGMGNLHRNYIHHVGSGIAYYGTGRVMSGVAEGNYVDQLIGWGDPATNGNHSDGFTVRDFDASQTPGRTLVVRNNRIDCDSANSTGAMFIQTYGGNINNVTMDGNLFEGYGYQLGLEQGWGSTYAGLSLTDNRFSGTGFGPGYVQNGPGFAEQSGNYRNDPAAPDNKGQALSFA